MRGGLDLEMPIRGIRFSIRTRCAWIVRALGKRPAVDFYFKRLQVFYRKDFPYKWVRWSLHMHVADIFAFPEDV